MKKLGIKDRQHLIILHAPKSYSEVLGRLPDNVHVASRLESPLDFIQFFTVSRAELESEFPRLIKALSQDGMLWVSWPKRSSKVDSDLSGNTVMDIGLRNGLVDVKVCAVDETWSGLKFVRRLMDRS